MRLKFVKVLLSVIGLVPAVVGAHASGWPASGFAVGGSGMTSFYVIGFELGPWQEYLAQELTPSYMLPENTEPVRISWLNRREVFLLPDFAADLESPAATRVKLDFQWQGADQFLWIGPDSDKPYRGSSFERQYFAPGVEHEINDGGILGVSAIIAHQRYSAANLGLVAATTPDDGAGFYQGYSPYQEAGYGTGVRLAVRQEIFSGLHIDAGFQSRIDMAEFAAYRGVYSQSADLDIPARASFSVAFQASERSWFNVAVERVLYSDISAFPSRFLPNRFLSLLGDSTSPSFDWQDLTVYRVGFNWSDGKDQQWHVDVSTRAQPSPSSRLLSRALDGDLASSALVLGYSRRTGDRSSFKLNAAYAPAEYAFGGSVLGVTTEELGQRLELEALWTMSF